jgi:hypothetical protein
VPATVTLMDVPLADGRVAGRGYVAMPEPGKPAGK